MKNLNKIIKVAQNLGWYVDVTEEQNYVNFSQCSPAGQDFNIEITYEDVEDIPQQVREFYDGFDVSYETYLWLDETGHGKNGAPYDMKELYEDMEECETMTGDLAEALEEIDFNEDEE